MTTAAEMNMRTEAIALEKRNLLYSLKKSGFNNAEAKKTASIICNEQIKSLKNQLRHWQRVKGRIDSS